MRKGWKFFVEGGIRVIKALRIDDRLIHGQVVTSWCAALNLTNIVVANDVAATDNVVSMALKMAAPSNIKVAIKKVEDAVTLLQDPRCESLSILVIVKNPADALILVKAVDEIPYVNVGNFGQLAGTSETERKAIYGNFLATDQELEQFREIAKLKPASRYQQVAVTAPVPLGDIVK
jgi:PTS system mannose-specific IIB component